MLPRISLESELLMIVYLSAKYCPETEKCKSPLMVFITFSKTSSYIEILCKMLYVDVTLCSPKLSLMHIPMVRS